MNSGESWTIQELDMSTHGFLPRAFSSPAPR